MLISKRALYMTAVGLVLLGPRADAQSLLDRPPNVSGNWVGSGGMVYFNFLHRFIASDPPERKVSNAPSFVLAVGLPARTLLGVNYATNSQLAPRYPNEWEFFARHALLTQGPRAPLDLAAQVGYNLAAEGIDGELSLARREGRLRIVAAGRVLSDPGEGSTARFAAAGGATLRLSPYVALAGDVASLLDRREEERIAWGAGLHLALPYTPHTFSLQAANTNAGTLQGTSRGEDRIRYGFEFTVPITLRRWFGGGGRTPAGQVPAATPAPTPAGEPAAQGTVVEAGMRNLAYVPARIEITAGTTVEWRNQDVVAHTVTAEDASFDSGLIEPGSTWRHTFDEPGTYSFFCVPHPFMRGVVVVR